MKTVIFFSAVQAGGEPALRIVFTLAVLLMVSVGILIYRRREQLFGRDSEVENDPAVVRHNRMEEIIFVWGGLTLVLFSILYQLWFD
jgi:hypothetical protein